MSLKRDSPTAKRRPSIVERASAVMEEVEGRLTARNKSLSTNTLQSLATEEQFSMNPGDYELSQSIGIYTVDTGQGSSATVYLASYKPKQKAVAVKVIDLDMFERNQIDELRREIQTMVLSRHPNLLPVYGSFVNGSKLFIVTPFSSAGSVLDILKTAFKNGMEENAIAAVLKQVLQGLQYLHAHGLIHRDIKAGNLLVSEDGLVQLGDFGVSSSLTDHGARHSSRKTFVGTPCWMAPEVMDQSGYDYKADIWSFGITALELAIGHAPYAKFPPMKILMLTLQNSPPTLDREKSYHRYTKTFKDMIDLCLQKDPTKRPTAEKLLNNSFFKNAKKPNYLASTILHGLPPVTDRPHRQDARFKTDDTQEATNDEWDFDEDSIRSQGDSNRPTSVRFKTVNDLLASSGERKEGEAAEGVVKKSRFVINGTKPVVAEPSSENSLQPPSEVKRGRFSVIDSSANPTGTISSLSSGRTSLPVSPRMHPVDEVYSNDSSNGNSIDAPLDKKVGDTSFSIGEKAIPEKPAPSIENAKPSPELKPTEGKTTRKFTIESAHPPEKPAPAPSAAVKDKRGRFEIIEESKDIQRDITKSLEDVPTNLSDSELLEYLLQRVQFQKGVIKELYSMVKKNGEESSSVNSQSPT